MFKLLWITDKITHRSTIPNNNSGCNLSKEPNIIHLGLDWDRCIQIIVQTAHLYESYPAVSYQLCWRGNKVLKPEKQNMLFMKQGWGVFWMDVLFWLRGGGMENNESVQGPLGVSWWEWAAGWRMTYSVSVCLSKGFIDALRSADKQEVAFSHPDMSLHGKTACCMSAPLHYSVLPPTPPQLHHPP